MERKRIIGGLLHARDHLAIGCPTRYWTRHFFNNSNTNEDIATKFEHLSHFLHNEVGPLQISLQYPH